jgi:hypothetical protein
MGNEEEYIKKIGIKEVSYFLTDLLYKRFEGGQIPVLVDDKYMWQVIFTEADKYGRPMRSYVEFLTLPSLFINNLMTERAEISYTEVTATKFCVRLINPVVAYNFRPSFEPDRSYYFMWMGKIIDRQEIPVEKLDVKELLRLAQKAIKDRNGIIIDEVAKNRLIKGS